jgi:hypothetical protein
VKRKNWFAVGGTFLLLGIFGIGMYEKFHFTWDNFLLMLIIAGLIVFLLYRKKEKRNKKNRELYGYKKALQQSKLKYSKKEGKRRIKKRLIVKAIERPKLRVIEGGKSNKK